MRAFCGALEMRVACSLFGSGNAQVITPVAGTDFHFASGSLAAVDALLDRPSGAAVAAGSVFVADEFNHMVLRISTYGESMSSREMESGGFLR
jgi:hypothetical protein